MSVKKLSRLPVYSPGFQNWLDIALMTSFAISRRLNNLFPFSAIDATEDFIHFEGLVNIVFTDRVYYRLLDLSQGKPSLTMFFL
jgi:hypothetical protein